MCVGGFLISLPVLNVFCRYVFHYIDYQAYVFQGMMVKEFNARTYECSSLPGSRGRCHCMYQSTLEDQCKTAGVAVLQEYGYALGQEGKCVGILIPIIAVYRIFGWAVTWMRKTSRVSFEADTE